MVPIGCAATAYFLMSGIKSFQNQDPRKGQKMMRLRVGAQFATLAMFAFYVGLDKINFEIAYVTFLRFLVINCCYLPISTKLVLG